MYKSMRLIVNNYLKENVTKNDVIVDATIGNGNDTLLLANLAKFVYGFDIQKKALINTKNLLETNNITNYKLIKDSHLKVYNYLTEFKGIVFNLGYLPKGDKTIHTNALETLETIKLLTKNNPYPKFICITCYVGHEEGKKEANLLLEYVKTLPNNYQLIKHLNESSPLSPFILIIEKKED